VQHGEYAGNNGDRRIIDENTDRERESAERHDVDCLSQDSEHVDGRQNQHRNGDRDDESTAPGTEEKEDHRRGERNDEHSFADHATDRALAEDPSKQRRVLGVTAMGPLSVSHSWRWSAVIGCYVGSRRRKDHAD
jgi:hypothetical protein